jgi:hypothetical protein
MPVLLDVNVTAMAGVELPPHPDRPSVRTASNPENNTEIVTLFTDNPFRHTRARSFSRFFPKGYHALAIWLPQVTEVL